MPRQPSIVKVTKYRTKLAKAEKARQEARRLTDQANEILRAACDDDGDSQSGWARALGVTRGAVGQRVVEARGKKT